MKGQPTSIRIFLEDGDPDGVRVVTKSNWNGQAFVVSRSQYPEVRKRDELQRPGVYLLVSPLGESAKPLLYIGETDELSKRLDNHFSKREGWSRLVAFSAVDRSLNKAHYRYLESRLLVRAKEAKTWMVENDNSSRQPNLSPSDVADAELFLLEMLTILPVLGIDAFEIPEVSNESAPVLYLNGELTDARGVDEPEGFLVFEGAIARKAVTPSFKQNTAALRTELIHDGVLVPEGDSYKLTQNYRFTSPSMAASVLLGRSANGREEWKSEEGRTLKDLQEASLV